jgi:hypothetical protein
MQDYRSQPNPYTLIQVNRALNEFVIGDDEIKAGFSTVYIPGIHLPYTEQYPIFFKFRIKFSEIINKEHELAVSETSEKCWLLSIV